MICIGKTSIQQTSILESECLEVDGLDHIQTALWLFFFLRLNFGHFKYTVLLPLGP